MAIGKQFTPLIQRFTSAAGAEAREFVREVIAVIASSKLLREGWERRTADFLYDEAYRRKVADLIYIHLKPLTVNLRRRLDKARAEGHEDEMMRLLGKIPEDERHITYPELDRLTDAEFDAYIDRLKHDPLPQTGQRLLNSVSRVVVGSPEQVEQLRQKAEGFNQRMKRIRDEQLRMLRERR